jgi:hypothetical protein
MNHLPGSLSTSGPGLIGPAADKDLAHDYRSARALFLYRCRKLELFVESYRHVSTAPDGGPLYTDAVRLGPEDATKSLIIVSGTHGVEGYAGSHAQRALLTSLARKDRPADVNILLLHLINPWGTAWRRRHDENNVDLNRSFVDRTGGGPINESHAALVEAGLLESLSEPDPHAALSLVDRFRAVEGNDARARAIFQGQYDEPSGLGYGGNSASWSQRTLSAAISDLLKTPRNVALIDLHSGLGPFGVGTVICTEERGSHEVGVLRGWYGDPFVALLEDRQDMPYTLQGDLAHGVRATLPGARVLPISLEFGTFTAERLAALMIEDAWARRLDESRSADLEAVRCELMHFFFPRSASWRSLVAARTIEIAKCALAGLATL